MSTITKERLEPVIERLEHYATNVKWTNVQAAKDMLIAVDAMRRLLASLEAEPVSVFKIDHESSLIKHVKKVVSETNAPPAPVSVMDNRAITPHFETIFLLLSREIMYDVNRRHEFPGGEIQLVSRIQCKINDAFRDAMLQGADGNSPVIPDGWKLVPIDPTKDMLRAGQSVVGFWLNTVHCYSKMLSAAPAAPQQEVKP